MLPGFRFLFAATLLAVSLLIFGLGAAALLRASHERFVSLPRQLVPAPVFAQVSDVAPPTLSMLRVEQTPPADLPPASDLAPLIDTLLPTDRIASLSSAPRAEEPMPAPPVAVEPKPEVTAEIKPEPPNVGAQPEPAPEPVQAAAPIAPPVEPVAVAKIDEPAKVEAPAVVAPAPAPQQVATGPEPEITGSTPLALEASAEQPLINAKPIRKPPIPADRPAAAGAVAALPDPTVAASGVPPEKPVLRRRKPVVKRVRETEASAWCRAPLRAAPRCKIPPHRSV